MIKQTDDELQLHVHHHLRLGPLLPLSIYFLGQQQVTCTHNKTLCDGNLKSFSLLVTRKSQHFLTAGQWFSWGI
jgi:hypothetical protein